MNICFGGGGIETSDRQPMEFKLKSSMTDDLINNKSETLGVNLFSVT